MYKALILITCFLFQYNNAHSEVYKWTDENGKTVYGDRPATEEVSIVEIKKHPAQDKEYQERYKKQQKLLNVMKEERDEKIAQQEKEKEEAKKQEIKCANLKEEYLETKNASMLYEETEDPDNPRVYSDEERKAEEEKLKKYINENC